MKKQYYDVIVIGGGSAGTAAALAASRYRAKTLLVERHGCFGGEATNSWISAYCGFYTRGKEPEQVVYGIGEEVLAGLRNCGEDTKPVINPSSGNASVRFHPENVKRVLDELLLNSDVDARLFCSVIQANRNEDGSISSITLQDDEDTWEVEAKAYVDCSGEANLLHLAGIPTEWGNNEGKVQQSSLAVMIGNLPRKEFPMEEMAEAIRKAKDAGYENLDKEKGMIVKAANDDLGFMTIPSVEIDSLSSALLTKKSMNLRKKAYAYCKALADFDPELKDLRFLSTAPYLGIRESRRMIGWYRVTGEEVLQGRKCEDVVARCSWPAEVHGGKGASYYTMKDGDYYALPLQALMCRDAANVFAAGRIVSCDSLALASLRVMGTSFATGQAAGAAAAVYAETGTAEVKKVQQVLKNQSALL